ncbi:CLUMA_CG012890, isoform A [Clunio marinus]|uniref:CLUMA_CG012890, isoform A n=1 Tax=Clunio marinus TaxID=568069 RepID=A0A1J1IM82_9DIPT|nr:CLUMA_CG012890, isoform A [Clunio marinus]
MTERKTSKGNLTASVISNKKKKEFVTCTQSAYDDIAVKPCHLKRYSTQTTERVLRYFTSTRSMQKKNYMSHQAGIFSHNTVIDRLRKNSTVFTRDKLKLNSVVQKCCPLRSLHSYSDSPRALNRERGECFDFHKNVKFEFNDSYPTKFLYIPM